MLKAALPYAKTPDEKAMVQSRIADMQRYLDAVEASKQRSKREPEIAADTVPIESTSSRVSLVPGIDEAPDYPKVAFSTMGYIAKGDIEPCKAIDGMKGKVEYAEVSDKRVAGQILSIELSK